MSAERTVWIVGATSILGWTLANTETPGLRIIPTCSRHGRGSAERGWLHINVETPADWAELKQQPPDILVYCAGVCNVQRCAAHPKFAWAVNLGGVEAMLDAVPDSTRLVLCSSDHVFAGRPEPYVESTPPDPLSVYGQTRVASERCVLDRRPDALVVRVALPIGASMNGRVGHLDWLRYRHSQGLPMTVVRGEHRAAVWADDGAKRILTLAQSDLRGIRHLAATRVSARPQLAATLCRHLGLEAAYGVVARETLGRPHLGHIDLQTEHRDALAAPLPAVIDEPFRP
ncbi:MAG: sugar nucleotide-binding protein [Deltaproteobacteria bacterium]|nr:sugar nucleotide-binding protein [Deltaproteobacteria bacterium]